MERMDWWRDAKLGLFIHWGPYARLRGRWQDRPLEFASEWSRHTEWIPDADYRRLALDWDPQDLDTDAWTSLAQTAGMGYVVFTTKHHDGFCMFEDAGTSFSLARARSRRDALAELAASCSRSGVRLGCYYSPRDWDHADYLPRYQTFAHAGPRWGGRVGYARDALTGPVQMYGLHPGRVPAADDFHDCGCRSCQQGRPLLEERTTGAGYNRYRDYMWQHLETILERHDPAILWFDGNDTDPAVAGHDRLLARIRERAPHIIVNDRLEIPADFGIHEGVIPGTALVRDWESCRTVAGSWGWNPLWPVNCTVAELVHDLCATTARGGNLLINVGPDDQGQVGAEEIRVLTGLGTWLRRFGDAIYGTRMLDTGATSAGCQLVRKGGDAFALITAGLTGEVLLPGFALRPGTRAELVGSGTTIPWRSGPDGAGVLQLASLDGAAIAGEPAIAVKLVGMG